LGCPVLTHLINLRHYEGEVKESEQSLESYRS
jgi:hypothetical protein